MINSIVEFTASTMFTAVNTSYKVATTITDNVIGKNKRELIEGRAVRFLFDRYSGVSIRGNHDD